MIRQALQFAKLPELTTADDIARDIETIRAAREGTRKELLGLRVSCRRLASLIASMPIRLRPTDTRS